ncbi:MAG: cupin domain-containing protein [Alphaproteobacteria bacterium]
MSNDPIAIFKAQGRQFKKIAGPPGALSVARLVEAHHSTDLGAGIAVFEDISIPWKVLYNEVFYVLEGEFRLRIGDTLYVGVPGDLMFIKAGTEFRYESIGRSKVFFALADTTKHEEERGAFEESLKHVRPPKP